MLERSTSTFKSAALEVASGGVRVNAVAIFGASYDQPERMSKRTVMAVIRINAMEGRSKERVVRGRPK